MFFLKSKVIASDVCARLQRIYFKLNCCVYLVLWLEDILLKWYYFLYEVKPKIKFSSANVSYAYGVNRKMDA